MDSPKYNKLAAIAVAYAAGLVCLRCVGPAWDTTGYGWTRLICAAAPIVGGIAGLHVARHGLQRARSDRGALGWLALALAGLLLGGGMLLSAFYSICLHAAAPSPGPLDLFYLPSHIAVATAAIVLLMRASEKPSLEAQLDGCVCVGALTVGVWCVLVQRLLVFGALSYPSKLVAAAGPLLDLVALYSAVVLVHAPGRKAARSRGSVALFAGIALLTAGDSIRLYYASWGDSAAHAWPAVIRSVAWLALTSALLLHRADAERITVRADQGAPARRPLVGLIPIAFAVAVCVDLAVGDAVTYGSMQLGTAIALFTVMALIAVRQAFMTTENERLLGLRESAAADREQLAERLRSYSDDLEQLVALRAQQLGALHQLTKAVHTTQQVDGVVEAAARHTAIAMRGASAAIWLRDCSPDGPVYSLSSHIATVPAPAIDRFIGCFAPRSSDSAYTVAITDSPSGDSGSLGEMLCAPLRFRNELLGVIGVVRAGADDGSDGSNRVCAADPFDRSDGDLLESIGIEVATALHHARRFAAAIDAADHDPVTNLYNHRAIHQRLDEELALARAESRPLTVMMMDLNDFKLFNDTYGHPVGDQVLMLVARALTQEIPDGICARYGGDEFLVLNPRTTAQQAREYAERLRQRLISSGFQSPLSREQSSIPIGISFGLAMYPDDCVNRQELLALADSNLYKAKSSDSGIGLTNAAQRANRRLKAESSFGILDAMVASVHNKDKYTRQHSEDVTKYALWLAQELRLSDETMRVIRIGAMLHDVGKIGIPEEILRKPGHLSAEEYEVIKQHPSLGALIVGAVPGMESIVDAVRFHHERWDGRGYPDKLGGTEIPMIGRIMAVADAFSAMTTNRAYRAGMDWQSALDEIRKNTGTQFDPLMARAFCNAVRWRLSIEVRTDDDDGAGGADSDSELPLAA